MSARPSTPALSRRDLLSGLSATALLAACQDPVATTSASADASADTGGSLGDATSLASDTTASTTPPLTAITSNDRFYVTSCCGTPTTDTKSWTLQILDRGTLLATLDMAFLESLKPRDKEHTLECIGGGPAYQLISNGVWTGLPLTEIFAAKGLNVPTDAPELKITGLDEFTTGLPASALTLPIWLVWRLNGEALPPAHGFPARLLVPNRYGMKNPKWVKSIEFVAEPYIGFWETQGWSKTAFYKPNAYIREPGKAATLKPGPVNVAGTAFAGSDPIAKVEVRIDGGPWQLATLDYTGVADVWTLWHFAWLATAGSHTVQARCTTASGAMSAESPEGTNPLAGYDGSMTISVTVA